MFRHLFTTKSKYCGTPYLFKSHKHLSHKYFRCSAPIKKTGSTLKAAELLLRNTMKEELRNICRLLIDKRFNTKWLSYNRK